MNFAQGRVQRQRTEDCHSCSHGPSSSSLPPLRAWGARREWGYTEDSTTSEEFSCTEAKSEIEARFPKHTFQRSRSRTKQGLVTWTTEFEFGKCLWVLRWSLSWSLRALSFNGELSQIWMKWLSMRDIHTRVSCCILIFFPHFDVLCDLLLGSLSKHDVDESENVIWKCDFAFLQSFFDYSDSLCLKNVF